MDTAREFTSRFMALLSHERGDLVDFLLLLADFDRRRLWVGLGHATLFSFLTRELGLSTGTAYYRKTAADLVAKYPEIVEALRDGRLCITSVVELAKVITPENRAAVLPRFFHASKKQAKEVAAEIVPVAAPPLRVVTTVVSPAVAPSWVDGAEATEVGMDLLRPVETDGPQRKPSVPVEAPPTPVVAPVLPRPRDEVEPLTATLRRMHVTVSRRFLEKLDAARAALSHSHPGATYEDVLEKGLDLVLQRQAKRRGLVAKPRGTARRARPSTVTAAVRRQVWKRANGRCEWPLAGGGVCGSTLRLENAHVVARARGGPPTADNLNLHCRFHNDLAARRDFGDEFVERFGRKRPRPR